MNILEKTSNIGADRCKQALDEFLLSYLAPAFGALPKQEVELLVLRLLSQIEAINKRPSLYELVSNLKVTRSKARRLIYEQELRTRTSDELDNDVRSLLRRPIIQKLGSSFALEIENPLLSDHIRFKLKELGHVSDGSFSPNIVTLSLDAMVSLIDSYMSINDQSAATDALIAAGAQTGTFKAILKGALKKLGEKIAGEAGQALAEVASNYIGSILDASQQQIAVIFKDFFEEKK